MWSDPSRSASVPRARPGRSRRPHMPHIRRLPDAGAPPPPPGESVWDSCLVSFPNRLPPSPESAPTARRPAVPGRTARTPPRALISLMHPYEVRGVLCYAHRFRPHPSLARHLPPRRGRLLRQGEFFYVLPLILLSNRRCLYISRNDHRSLPPGGEGGTPVPDEGETVGRTHASKPSIHQMSASWNVSRKRLHRQLTGSPTTLK